MGSARPRVGGRDLGPVGARTAEQAAENSVAAGLVLAPEELRFLDRAFRSRILREPLARRVRSAGGRVLRRLGLR